MCLACGSEEASTSVSPGQEPGQQTGCAHPHPCHPTGHTEGSEITSVCSVLSVTPSPCCTSQVQIAQLACSGLPLRQSHAPHQALSGKMFGKLSTHSPSFPFQLRTRAASWAQPRGQVCPVAPQLSPAGGSSCGHASRRLEAEEGSHRLPGADGAICRGSGLLVCGPWPGSVSSPPGWVGSRAPWGAYQLAPSCSSVPALAHAVRPHTLRASHNPSGTQEEATHQGHRRGLGGGRHVSAEGGGTVRPQAAPGGKPPHCRIHSRRPVRRKAFPCPRPPWPCAAREVKARSSGPQ